MSTVTVKVTTRLLLQCISIHRIMVRIVAKEAAALLRVRRLAHTAHAAPPLPLPTRPGTPARPRGGGEVEQREQSAAGGAEPLAVRPHDGHPPPPMPRLRPPAMPLAAARPSRCSPR